MAKTPKPWFRKGRGWFVTIGGKQHNLGPERKSAYQEYYRLMQQPAEQRKVSGQSLAANIDDFLEYLSKNRAPDTYRWYRDLLQKFILLHPSLSVDDVRPYHVQRWVDGYEQLFFFEQKGFPQFRPAFQQLLLVAGPSAAHEEKLDVAQLASSVVTERMRRQVRVMVVIAPEKSMLYRVHKTPEFIVCFRISHVAELDRKFASFGQFEIPPRS